LCSILGGNDLPDPPIGETLELRTYLDFLRRHWWLLLAGCFIAGAVAYVVSNQQTRIYRSTAELILIDQANSSDALDDRLTNTYANLVTRRAVLTQVKNRLALSTSEDDLASKIRVSARQQTQLLLISVDDPDPNLAAAMANTTANAFIDDNAANLTRPANARVIEEARAPDRPISPNIPVNTFLAALLGLLVAGGISLGRDLLDDTVKDAESVKALSGLPTLGVIRRFKKSGSAGALLSADLSSGAAEDYRQLRTTLHFLTADTAVRSLLITGEGPGEGNTVTAVNLARMMALAGDRVILVDADLERPSLHNLFGIPNSVGLTSLLLSEERGAWAALAKTDLENLLVLPAGPIAWNPADLLTSKRLAEILAGLKAIAEYVLVDGAPLLLSVATSLVAAQTDGVILVVEAKRTRAESLQEAIQRFQACRATILGVVVNKAKADRPNQHRTLYVSAETAPDQASNENWARLGSDPAHE
jgi:succinoglycan biosynthesis transport protein ExoP